MDVERQVEEKQDVKSFVYSAKPFELTSNNKKPGVSEVTCSFIAVTTLMKKHLWRHRD